MLIVRSCKFQLNFLYRKLIIFCAVYRKQDEYHYFDPDEEEQRILSAGINEVFNEFSNYDDFQDVNDDEHDDDEDGTPGVPKNHYIDSDESDDNDDDDEDDHYDNDDDDLEDLNLEDLTKIVKDILPPVAPNFSIFEEGMKIDRQSTGTLRKDEKIHPLGEEGSKMNFSRDLKELLVEYHCCEAFETSLLRLLHKHLRPFGVDIPYTAVKYSQNPTKVRGWKSTLNEYCGGDSVRTSLMFDICRNGCCVFAGPLKDSLNCPNCSADRYRSCPQCHALSSEPCKRSVRSVQETNIPICSKRVAHSVTYYRPLIPLLMTLAETQEFIFGINYTNDDLNFKVPIIGDKLNTRTTWSKHKQQMQQNFSNFCSKNNFEKENITEVSLYLSLIYDGIQLYKHKFQHCWPLAISIENLPPNLRSKPGIGSFLLSIRTESAANATADHCRGVEYFLFRDCLVEELLILSSGLYFESESNSPIFLQARMLLTALDGRANEEFYNFQGGGSLAGCALCGIMPGRFYKILHKVVYYGHRKLLPYDNVLRSYGQSQQCCPKDQKSSSQTVFADNKDLGRNKRQWFHEPHYPFSCFSDSLYYEDCDYREYFPKLPIRTQQDILKLSITAQRFYNHVRDKSKGKIMFLKNVHKRKYAPKSGIKGLCPFYILDYFKIEESLCWDPFHVITGIIKHLLELLIGETANSASEKEFCKSKNVHPSLWQENTPLWFIRKSLHEMIDEVFEYLYIPKNESEHYELKSGILGRSGMLKGAAKLRLLINYMDFFVFVAGLPKPYADLFSMLSSDICQLYEPLSPTIDVELLTNRIFETLSTFEGMIPESEAYMLSHQLIHLSAFRLRQGTIKNTSTLGAERYVGAVGNEAKTSGQTFLKTLFQRFMTLEQSESLKFSEYLRWNPRDSPFLRIRKYRDGSEVLEYSEFRYYLTGAAKTIKIPSLHFWGSLIAALLLDIESRSSSFADAMSSPLYQLLKIFTTNIDRKQIVNNSYACGMFAKWIRDCDLNDEYEKARTRMGFQNTILHYFNEPVRLADIMETKTFLQNLWDNGITISNEAYVAGQKFPSRGFKFQETDAPKDRLPIFHDNLFRVLLSTKVGKDSLCKACVPVALHNDLGDILKRDFTPRGNKSADNHVLFGEAVSYREVIASINGFFRIQLPADERYSIGVPFAAVNCWKIEKRRNDRLYLVNNDDGDSYFPQVRFVPIRNIVPSRLALSCLDVSRNVLPRATESLSSVKSKWTVTIEMDRPRRSVMNLLAQKQSNIYSQDNFRIDPRASV